ncbi:MAG: hypothetical protein GF328_00315 [Candidatus Latescibacteria bacterium]|nr:hypothetical protein [Candidatus Latescibacterota bacterium]
MKKAVVVYAVVALSFAFSGASRAGERSLEDLGREMEALTLTISAQIKLLGIYEDLGKTEEAAATRERVLELVASYRKLLDEVTERMGKELPEKGTGGGRGGPGVKFRVDREDLELPTEEEWEKASRGPVERGVFLGLDWLARHQSEGGFWDCDGFMKEDRKPPGSGGPGRPLYDPGVTGLALLAFLEADQTHKHGPYRAVVGDGLRYLKQIQDPEGCFGPRTSNHFIYGHAIATLAMCEAYEKTASPLFKQSAQSGIDFLHKCQNPYLAWRYGIRPGDNDTSVTGWCVAALRAGKRAGLRVDQATFDGAKAWLDKVTEPEYGRVGYTTRGSGPARPQDLMDKFPADKSESLTAEGICIRLAVGEDPKRSEMIHKGTDLVVKMLPAWNEQAGTIDMYYWFWGTRAMAALGGDVWRRWGEKVREAVLPNQRDDGGARGSWDPIGPWGREGGRIYSTALLTMVLETLEDHPVPATRWGR